MVKKCQRNDNILFVSRTLPIFDSTAGDGPHSARNTEMYKLDHTRPDPTQNCLLRTATSQVKLRAVENLKSEHDETLAPESSRQLALAGEELEHNLSVPSSRRSRPTCGGVYRSG